MPYVIYLRKSRADLDAEAHGEGETLARHEATLLDLARRNKYDIGAIYKEIVSGDTIAARPQMQKLISEVSAGIWEGVLVMEVERLARGETIDQGIVAQAFKYSNTKIITPYKTYDPNNEFDETFFEFNLFMSRQEYKTIRRRMQAGRVTSVKEGNFIQPHAPYGYKINNKGKHDVVLEVVPEEAEIVRLIYKRYTEENKGSYTIAEELNAAHIKRSDQFPLWTSDNVMYILTNPTYCGYVRRQTRVSQKYINADGVKSVKSNRSKNPELYKGKHEAIISEEAFDKAQKLKATRQFPHIKKDYTLRNPLTGLIYCSECGKAMSLHHSVSKSKQQFFLQCRTYNCTTKMGMIEEVENLILSSLREKYDKLSNFSDDNPAQENISQDNIIIARATDELAKLNKQRDKLYELLEQEIYTPEIFAQRMAVLSAREKELRSVVNSAPPPTSKMSVKDAKIKLGEILKQYESSTVEEKNNLLKSVIRRIEYSKTKSHKEANLTITIDFLF